jgi:hypothetical protein
MSDRPTTPAEDAGEPDPTVTFALRAMAPPEHGDGFWDRVDATIRAESVAPTTAVPLVAPAPPTPPPPPAPPPPPMAEIVPLPAPRRSWPGAPWIAAAAAAVLVVALAAGLAVRSGTTDVETTTAATGAPVESTTSVPPPPVSAPTSVAPTVAPPASARPAPTSTAAPRTTTTAKPMSLTLSPAGLGPLRLGMTADQAQATGAVGPFEDPLDTGGACGHAVPAGSYRAGDFGALFLDGRLARIYVSDGSRLRTPQGIGVGSASSKLSDVPGTRSENPHPYGGGTNVDIMTGAVGYQFTVDQGAVTEWSVGTTEALALPEGCA